MKTFWLSFADETGHLGVAVVDVNDHDLAQAEVAVALGLGIDNPEDAQINIIAAVRVARNAGCNPGGEVMAVDLTDSDDPRKDSIPRNQLLSWNWLIENGYSKPAPLYCPTCDQVMSVKKPDSRFISVAHEGDQNTFCIDCSRRK